ncbi:MAG TPA: hypothetical protein VGW40_11390 [Allosphingosinicella sp.]|nr:hypothetical protein [Allosphingosinicella sp.]
MRATATLAAAAALAALAGCNQLGAGGGNANNGSANAAADNVSAGGGNAAAPAADAGGKLNEGGGATPAAASGIVLDRAFLVGRWTDVEDCGNAIEFTQDGRFIAANGGTGLWNLEGDELTMSGADTATIRIVPIDRDTITVVNPDRSLGRSTRC